MIILSNSSVGFGVRRGGGGPSRKPSRNGARDENIAAGNKAAEELRELKKGPSGKGIRRGGSDSEERDSH